MEAEMKRLTLEYLQAQISGKRMSSHYFIDQFECARNSNQKTNCAFLFARLAQEVDLLEFVVFLLESSEEIAGMHSVRRCA
jgi:hypothetical protein